MAQLSRQGIGIGMDPRFAFPDLHPPPHAAGDRSSSSSSSSQRCHLLQQLTYISGILMDEEGEDDHPSLLHAQHHFAQIISSSSTATAAGAAFLPDQGGVLPADTRTSSSPKDHNGDQTGPTAGDGEEEYSTAMFSAAFFKGMEEASRFLPTGSNAVAHHKERRGGGDGPELEAEAGRESKMAMAEQVEDGAREMFDKMMLHGYGSPMGNAATKKKARRRRGLPDVVDLHTLLIHCAKAVMDDRRSALDLLNQIKQHASPTGDVMQRIAYLFGKGLEARLSGMGSHVYRPPTAKRGSGVDFLKAYQLFMSTCCFRKVAFTFANRAIFNVAVGKRRLHIVDYGLHHGFQWPELLRWLGARDGGPPEVRMTHIDIPQPGFRPAMHIEEMGNRLSHCARELGVPFKFRTVMSQWQAVGIDDLNTEPDEVLAVNDMFDFRTLMDESVVMDSPSPRDTVLSNISKMQPDVFVQGTMNGSYGTTFLSRFRESLFYHSALFDMLDATMPHESQLRLLVERDVFGWVALNAIACEGKDRVERGETYRQWQVRNQRAGLRQLPLNRETVKMVRSMVKNQYHKDFVIGEDQQWLLQGWKGRILFAHSTWVADVDDAS